MPTTCPTVAVQRLDTRVSQYHINSSVLNGYEICMEGAGHKRLMNISQINPDGRGTERSAKPQYWAEI